MADRINQFLVLMQFTRIALVFTAISNIWLVLFLAKEEAKTNPLRNIHEHATWEAMLLTGLVGAGLYIFGMTLNDLMDVRHDRNFAPKKPLPSGQLSQRTAFFIVAASLFTALIAAVLLGKLAALVCIGCAALIVFYDAAGKFLTTIGLISLGVIRLLNMLIADPQLQFTWPAWVTMIHVIVISVICYKLEGKRPKLQSFDLWAIVAGAAFCSLLLFAWMGSRPVSILQTYHTIWIGPGVAMLAFSMLAIYLYKKHQTEPRKAGMAIMKFGLIWLIVYDAAWLFSTGLWREGLLVMMLLFAAFVSIATIRQLKELKAEEQFAVEDEPATTEV